MIDGEEATRDGAETEPRRGGHGKFTLAIVLILGIAIGIAVVLAVESWRSSDDDNLVPVETTQPTAVTTAPVATTQPVAVTTAPAAPAPSITPSPPAPDDGDPLAGAVWPLPDTETRYTDPVEAARGFAIDFVGFTDPVMSEFLVADSRSGEVEVKPSEDGPTTIVFLRKLDDDDFWWVLGSASQNVILQRPTVRDTVDSPLTVSGQARTFEGHVAVELRADGVAEPLFTGAVTGGAGPDFGPFEGTFEFTDPGSGGGALVAIVPSAEDGSVTEAAVMRLFFDAD
jgi:Immunoglobulin-like domain of bacterial spore germination